MKRIFEVNGLFFEKKEDAKVARGIPTKAAEGKTPAQYDCTIHKGPDHWAFGTARTQSVHVPSTRKKKRLPAEVTG